MINKWPAQAVAALSLIAVLPLPYGYYQFLRIAVCAAAVYYTYSASKQGTKLPAIWAAVLFGLLFNPIAPVYLDRSTWAVFNVLCAGYFFYLSRSQQLT